MRLRYYSFLFSIYFQLYKGGWLRLIEIIIKKNDFDVATGMNLFSNWSKSLCNLKKVMMINRGAPKTIASFQK